MLTLFYIKTKPGPYWETIMLSNVCKLYFSKTLVLQPSPLRETTNSEPIGRACADIYQVPTFIVGIVGNEFVEGDISYEPTRLSAPEHPPW